ncbi:MAG TPA: hypothetical protein VJT67_07915 [Longimicrobiaceae bacterium]|nr:hypothetical protein [Longimicrobiaceae bacterium]
MPRQNRVTPFGGLVAVPARGTFMGNRGCLHDAEGRIRRAHRGRRWIICTLEFKGRRLPLADPGRNTQLFFLDEATALAAGHRPCGECRRAAYRAFVDAWVAGNRGTLTSSGQIDELDPVLHRQRLAPRFSAPLDTLPDGVLIVLDGDSRPYLVLGDALLPWAPTGYEARIPRPSGVVEILTPECIVNALRAGYRPALHPSAAE